jgi:hypothetical protein
MSEERIAKLERELAELKAQVKPAPEPPKAREPWPKYDPTEGFRMPASAVQAMVDVVPDMRAIVEEQRHGRSEPGGFLGPEKTVAKEKGSGWRNPTPLEPPPGVAICDQLMDVQDKIDRAERIRGFGLAGLGGPRVMGKDES